MFKDDPSAGGTSAGGRGGKRKRDRERHDPQKTLKPSTFHSQLNPMGESDGSTD